ncbi:MAG: HepT-like ribonuclease domain-containing protein [Ginsengibacter sp.]
MRNKIVHNYDGIDTNIIWKTITQEILELKHQLEIILSQENELLDDEGHDIKIILRKTYEPQNMAVLPTYGRQ